MTVFDRYIFKNLLIATIFVAFVLTLIIFLTQSLRFLDLVINSGSSGKAFATLAMLALPRFFEVILPLSIMSATLFLYNKLTLDAELIAMRAVGHSSMALARPAIALGLIVTILLWGITMWTAPISLSKMQSFRTELKSEFSNFLFREGVFNNVGKGLMVFMRERKPDGEMAGLMIHDARDTAAPPSTILAKRGAIVSTADVQQVIVFQGSRQTYNQKSGILQKLKFDRYTIDLPQSEEKSARWTQPDERTITQLLNPDKTNQRDLENLREFNVEIHRRLTSPLLALGFPLIALAALVIGPVDRRGQGRRIAAAILLIMLIQGIFLSSYNIARNNDLGLILMYILSFAPIATSLFLLSSYGEATRRAILYKQKVEA